MRRFSRSVGAVMDDGAVGPRAGDGVEGQVLQRAGRRAECLQLHGGARSRRGRPLAPRSPASAGSGSAPRRRGRGRAGALDLDGVLARPSRATGSAPDIGAAAGRASKYQAEDWPGRPATRALRCAERCSGRSARRLQTSPVAAARRQVVATLAGRGTAGPSRRRSGSPGRAAGASADDVAAADVEQPGDGMAARSAPPRRRPAPARLRRSASRLARDFLAGVLERDAARPARAAARGGPSQAVSSGLAVDRRRARAGLGAAAFEALQRVRAVQARVVADLLAGLAGASSS